MSDVEFENALEIARQLVGRLPSEMDDELKRLIADAEERKDPAIGMDIVRLLTQNENIQCWMDEQDELRSRQERFAAGYVPLAGGRNSVSASRKWICPEAGCMRSLPVIQEDEDAPKCNVHRRVMVRDDRQKG